MFSVGLDMFSQMKYADVGWWTSKFGALVKTEKIEVRNEIIFEKVSDIRLELKD